MKYIWSLQNLYLVVSIFLISLLVLILLAHVLSKILRRKKPLNLNTDSIIVITGGCMGIGKQMAIEIARLYHATIIIIDRRKDLFEEISQEIKKYNGICQCLYSDLSDPKSVTKVIQQLKQYRKKIDFFIYNAGVFIPNLTWQASDEELQVVMNVNFFTPVKMVKQLMRQLEGGHIGIISSIMSILDGCAVGSSYVASKHALSAYFNSFRLELIRKKKPITISIGCPYAINTDMFKGFKNKLPLFGAYDQKYVGQRLVKEFINKKQECFIGRRYALIQKYMNFFPTFFRDIFMNFVDKSVFPQRKLEQVSDKYQKLE